MSEWYCQQFMRYVHMSPTTETIRPWREFDERTATTPVDMWTFYQDVWAFDRVVQAKPAWLLDVGSTAYLVGLLSRLLPVTSLDMRPLALELPGLTCLSGTITALPFEDNSVPMVSSISVIEHIGLGRYGDPLDPDGSQKACAELVRVLAPGGRLLLGFPTAEIPLTLFNAHRLLPVPLVEGWLTGCRRVGALQIKDEERLVWVGEYIKE